MELYCRIGVTKFMFHFVVYISEISFIVHNDIMLLPQGVALYIPHVQTGRRIRTQTGSQLLGVMITHHCGDLPLLCYCIDWLLLCYLYIFPENTYVIENKLLK